MKIIPTDELPEVKIIEPDVFTDDRGYFFEIFQKERFLQYDIPPLFVQDNISFSRRGVLRGLHYQLAHSQGKLVTVVHGEIFDVAVDIRKGSPSFGKWTSIILSSESRLQLYIPEGFAHGFCVLSESAHVLYKCTDYYAPLDERGIVWNDGTLDIPWPLKDPVLSPKDAALPELKAIPGNDLPDFGG